MSFELKLTFVYIFQVEQEDITCELCHKKCRSQGDLKRHKTVKHKNNMQEVKLSDGELVSFVEIAKVKLLESSIYPNSLVNELKSYTVCFSETDLSTLEDIYGYLIK